ncbi:MAG: hypothetical protein J0M12_11360 [Deltaproteobacteria bacterium]|nr:hypothetical protein [Deltaproteobacteria bacterium]
MKQLHKKLGIAVGLTSIFALGLVLVVDAAQADSPKASTSRSLKADDSTSQPTATEQAEEEADTDADDGDYQGDDSDDTATE